MLLRNLLSSKRVALHAKIIGRSVSQLEIDKYKNDSAALAQWLDVSIVARKGRAFDADKGLISKAKADTFPVVKAFNLEGGNVVIPDHIDAKAKLIVFSFKHYGFSLVRSWIDPFIAKYNAPTLPVTSVSGANASIVETAGAVAKVPNTGAVAYEICFVEYGFLSMAKSVFAGNIKGNVDPSQVDKTALVFGGVRDFAAQLLLPNQYTGYAYLLDRDNKVRWRGSGQALESEVDTLLRCTDELLRER